MSSPGVGRTVVVLLLTLCSVWSMGCTSTQTGPKSVASGARDGRGLGSSGPVDIPGLTPFPTVHKEDPAEGQSIDVPDKEQVKSYQGQLDALRNGKVTPDVMVSQLQESMQNMKVDRMDARVQAVKELVAYVQKMSASDYDAKRRDLAVELRRRVGTLRALRMRNLGSPWPPEAPASNAPSPTAPSGAAASPAAGSPRP